MRSQQFANENTAAALRAAASVGLFASSLSLVCLRHRPGTVTSRTCTNLRNGVTTGYCQISEVTRCVCSLCAAPGRMGRTLVRTDLLMQPPRLERSEQASLIGAHIEQLGV